MSDLREAETTSPTEEAETSHREALPDPSKALKLKKQKQLLRVRPQ